MGLLTVFTRDTVWVAAAGFGILTFTVFLSCIRRLYFHPLSKYPGPFFARLTDLYPAYHAWKGDLQVDMWRCHEKYGTFVRYAPETVNVINAAALRDIYGPNKNFQKSPQYRVLRHLAANTLTMVNKTEHARRRRIVSQGVSDSSMRFHEPTMLFHITKLFDRVSNPDDEGLGLVDDMKAADEGWTAPRNMSHWFNYLAFDIMGDLIFGTKYDLVGRPSNRYIVEAIEDSNVRVSVLLQSPIIPQFLRIDRWMFPKAIEARNQFLHFVSGVVDYCMKPESESSGRNLVSFLKASRDPETGGKLSAKELMAESTTLCVAGADTSSTAMASILFYLSRNPDAYNRAAQEVRSTFQSKDEIHIGVKLSSLTYLRACIDESLRMSPPAGSSLFRQVLKGGAVVNGEFFPEGVQLGVPIYGIHHNQEYHPSPFKFKPERWIIGEEDSTRETVERAQSAYCPFSIGQRSCVGKGMALTELMLTMAYTLFTLDFRLAEGDASGGREGAEKGWDVPGEFRLEDHITASKNGPMVQFRQRKTGL